MNIEEHVQQLELSPFIELIVVDATAVDGGIHRFCQIENTGGIKFQGWVWQPLPFSIEGFETSSTGTPPQPTLILSNVRGFATGLLASNNDLLGAEVHRYRTFQRFLDDGSDPDPDQYLGPDVYRVERKTAHTRNAIEFSLATSIDQDNVVFPRRPILQGFCPFRYRSYDPDLDDFVYTHAVCPYDGDKYFDRDGNSVASKSLDVAGKRFDTCCSKRFQGIFPFGGFLGAGRLPGR